jgi:phytoene dehydrogenase-like protein
VKNQAKDASPSAWSRRDAMAFTALAPWALVGCKTAHEITGGFTGTSPERGHLLRDARSIAAPSVTRTVHTLIAGGGVAGLSAARALRLRGMDDFALLELEDSAGGNARAGSIAGMSHPIGAHYLPVPGDAAYETQDFLEELGIRQRVSGRWQYDERTLCHSPQERLFIKGAWQDGLLPLADVSRATLSQYGQFAQLVERWRKTGGFQIPHAYTPQALQAMAQLAVPFNAYLDAQGLTDTTLRWYLDYCCRDDYGAGVDVVSAWAGIHYFAARHGFGMPGDKAAEAQHDKQQGGVLTWPEGNAYLTRALAAPLSERVHTGRVVLQITEEKSGVTVLALNAQTQAVERWQAQRCIVALPVFIAQRVVQNAPDFLRHAVQHTSYASWLVANVQINAPLLDTGVGAAPSWDNVIFNPVQTGGVAGDTAGTASPTGLGYVDAMHQSTRTAPGPSVLTYYRALGTSVEARRSLLAKPWAQHKDETLADLRAAHPDIDQRAVQISITRYGHAMAVPTPAFIREIGLQPKQILLNQLSNKERLGAFSAPRSQRLRFAHSDWAGYSVFEEAFRAGWLAAQG